MYGARLIGKIVANPRAGAGLDGTTRLVRTSVQLAFARQGAKEQGQQWFGQQMRVCRYESDGRIGNFRIALSGRIDFMDDGLVPYVVPSESHLGNSPRDSSDER